VEFHQLKPAVAVRVPHHCDVDSDAVEPDDAVRPTPLDCRLALQLQTNFDKEAIAAARSSTTTPTLSIRRIVMSLA
jgi:hypothetical protein